MHLYKEDNMFLARFLSKQQIFSPGLLTSPVLIRDVRSQGEREREREGRVVEEEEEVTGRDPDGS